MTVDVVVIGLGAAGSAALYHLARQGARAIGIEQFHEGHDRGSSHGFTRIIRLGYFEHPSYVPLVRRSFTLWRDLEAASGKHLLSITGILEMGRPHSALVEGTLRSSREHDLPHEVLDAKEVMRRYPAFQLPADYVGVMQPDGGYLEAEPAIAAHLALAKSAGAQVRENERVLKVEPKGAGVRVTTENGAIEAGAAIVAAGGWVKTLLPQLPLDPRVTRQVVFWLQPKEPALFTSPRFPVFMLEHEAGVHYGFPMHGENGFKVALHHHVNEKVDAENYSRLVTAEDEKIVRNGVARFLPLANGPTLTAKTCLYTRTPDDDFILDALPGTPQIIVASPCSGHGFKFAPVLGEILSDLALRGEAQHDISRFRLQRFMQEA